MGSSSLNILVADNNPTDRLLLKAILLRFGHSVVLVDNAGEILEKYDPEIIQLLCIDSNIDDNLWDLIGKIHAKSENFFVPIILLSDTHTPVDLVNSIKAGGTDFISKPYMASFVGAKLKAISKVLMLQKKLMKQRNELMLLNDKMHQDHKIAKLVYEKITHSNRLSAPCFRIVQYENQIFNGDIILAAYKPNGGMHFLLGDFTGHGLSAAIGALPLSETFFDWTRKGFLMKQIIHEINNKLTETLPIDMFCNAVMVDINFVNKTVEIWNGGISDVLFFSAESPHPRILKLNNLPLGVLSENDFSYTSEMIRFDDGDSLFLWSDGIYEVENLDGEAFFAKHIQSMKSGKVLPAELLSWLDQKLQQEAALDKQFDDISCVGITLSALLANQIPQTVVPATPEGGASQFSLDYELNADSLKSTDPLPYILQILMTVQGLHRYSDQVFMLLSESYSNALEHGVLQLDSQLKKTPEGFAVYFSQREKRLRDLQSGFVKIKLAVNATATGGVLVITVEDSGDGFDVTNVTFGLTDNTVPYNRGLSLIQQLCKTMEISEKGNLISMTFQWS